MQEIVAKFDFEELHPCIDGFHVEGLPAYGTATLVSADYHGEPHSYYVREIELAGHLTLRPDNRLTGQHTFRGQLFKYIADVLESDKTAHGKAAQMEFDDELEGHREPDPDAWYDEKRERQMFEAAE